MDKNEDIRELKKKFRLNGDQGVVAAIREGLKLSGGYCPCRPFEQSEDTRCICKEFREQLADDSFSGYCHCLLYYKPPIGTEETEKKKRK